MNTRNVPTSCGFPLRKPAKVKPVPVWRARTDENRIAGTARNIGGKVEEGVGRLTGDTKTQIHGIADQAVGTAQDLYGQARDAAADALWLRATALSLWKDGYAGLSGLNPTQAPWSPSGLAGCLVECIGRSNDRQCQRAAPRLPLLKLAVSTCRHMSSTLRASFPSSPLLASRAPERENALLVGCISVGRALPTLPRNRTFA